MEPVNRIVLLGASNLTLSLRLIIQLLQHQCGGPSEVLVAAGHGRSYGQSSQMLIRELPGIVRSGLWRQLQTGESRPVYAFLTDVGNDIPYGSKPEQILGWVSWCIQQLQRRGARIVMTNLPLNSIESLSDHRFKVLRNLLFPTCSLSRNEVIERARMVHQGLKELAVCHQLILNEPEPAWMSMDGIHISFWKRHEFYRRLFEYFANYGVFNNNQSGQVDKPVSNKTQFSFLSWQQRPQFAIRRVFGKIKQVSQPSGYIANQTTVSLY